MNFNITNEKICNIKADLEIIIVIGENLKHKFVQDDKLLEKLNYKGGQDNLCMLVEKDRLYVGADSIDGSDLRPAVATAIRSLMGNKNYKSIKIASYLNATGCSSNIRAITEGIILGSYSFDRYKSKKSKHQIKKVTISLEDYNRFKVGITTAVKAMHNGEITASATNFTRDIVNTPPQECYPATLAKIAKKMTKKNVLKCKILDYKEIKAKKMHALLAVANASVHKPRVIHLTHKPKETKGVIIIAGKGLTYDSGGLSLKPADYMVTMKSDKSGGSAVLGIMKAVSEMNLPIEVHGFIGAVENMIGGNAFKPDDILKSMSGKTIEVRNTDAEGRLVLADLLWYAQQEVNNPDYVIDIATLTGACVVGVGEYTTGVMGHNQNVSNIVLEAAKNAGEFATQLHFNKYLAKTIKSKIADVCNISTSRYGGSITAGQFLSEFIKDANREKWAHLDIAGPAFVESEWGENPYGASGAGVRMMISLIEKLTRGENHRK